MKPASSGIGLESPIGQESESRLIAAALSHLESAGVDCVAESQGGLGDRRHKEGLLRCMFGLKQVVFTNLGARIMAIVSAKGTQSHLAPSPISHQPHPLSPRLSISGLVGGLGASM